MAQAQAQAQVKVKFFNPEKGYGFVRTNRGDMFFKAQFGAKYNVGDIVFPVIQGANDKGLFGIVFKPEEIHQINLNLSNGQFGAVILTERGQITVPISKEDGIVMREVSLKNIEHGHEGFPAWKAGMWIGTNISWIGRQFTVFVSQANTSETYVNDGKCGGHISSWDGVRQLIEKTDAALSRHGLGSCLHLLQHIPA